MIPDGVKDNGIQVVVMILPYGGPFGPVPPAGVFEQEAGARLGQPIQYVGGALGTPAGHRQRPICCGVVCWVEDVPPPPPVQREGQFPTGDLT